MIKTIEVEVDSGGYLRPLQTVESLPQGRAFLTWETDSEHETMLLAEASLAVDWSRPEEDEAWAYMQPDK